MISPTKELIRLHAKQLRMPTFAQYEEIERQLDPSAGYDIFLLELLKRELDERQSSSQKRRIKQAKFPYIKTMSYLTFNRTKSELLFQVISERSERASVIVSTNLEFSRWTELFENDMMVRALIDRLTYRSHVLDMNIPDAGRFSLDSERKGEAGR